MKEYDLERFLKAQEGDYDTALSEIRDGFKRTHWMWYIFPQVKGLGFSHMSQYYGIDGLEEARAYLADETLKSRLVHACEALLEQESDDVGSIFGFPDDMKLKSSMTLFHEADAQMEVFRKVLDKFFDGHRDEKTLKILGCE